MKKLLASTALVGALVVSGSSFAETKFGGNVENTWTSKQTQTSAVAADSYDGIGTDIEITVDHTQDLSNGWKGKIAMAIDESGSSGGEMSVSRSYVQVSNDTVTLQLGVEGIQGAEIYPIPTVADISGDLPGLGSQSGYLSSLNNTHTLAAAVKVPFGTVEALLAPNSSAARSAKDSDVDAPADAASAPAGRGLEAAYKFSAMDGALTGGIGAVVKKSNGVAHDDMRSSTASLQYNLGSVKVGAGRTLFEDGANDASSTTDRERTTDSFGITLAASDDLSVGVQYKKTSSDEWSSDEKATVVQAAYNFGGIGFSLSMAQLDNDGGTAGTDNELVVFRTKTSF
jgi:hypothetical protein